MKKMLSEIIGMPIFQDANPERPISFIRDVIIDPEKGVLVAYLTMRRRILPFNEGRFFGDAFFVRSYDNLVLPDEIIRVSEILKRMPTLVGLPVYLENKKNYIGRVVDMELDLKFSQLISLHTANFFIFFRYDKRIISAKNIIEIKDNSIFVRNTAIAEERPSTKPIEVENLSPA